MEIKSITEMTLCELELEIKKLYKYYSKNEGRKLKRKIEAYLGQRSWLINNEFRFTPEIVKHIERVNQILTDKTAKVVKKASELDRQMHAIKAAGDDFLVDYEIEGTVDIYYNGENLFQLLNEDENDGQSDYHAMAEILCDINDLHLRSFCFSDSDTSHENEKNIYSAEMLKRNWNIELLSAPELRHIEYFCYASHCLFCHSNYSISDIIRINDFWSEVNVQWQNLGEK
jgi:hypothetical protein